MRLRFVHICPCVVVGHGISVDTKPKQPTGRGTSLLRRCLLKILAGLESNAMFNTKMSYFGSHFKYILKKS